MFNDVCLHACVLEDALLVELCAHPQDAGGRHDVEDQQGEPNQFRFPAAQGGKTTLGLRVEAHRHAADEHHAARRTLSRGRATLPIRVAVGVDVADVARRPQLHRKTLVVRQVSPQRF